MIHRRSLVLGAVATGLARPALGHTGWLRLFNEVPALLLVAIVFLVVVKPE